MALPWLENILTQLYTGLIRMGLKQYYYYSEPANMCSLRNFYTSPAEGIFFLRPPPTISSIKASHKFRFGLTTPVHRKSGLPILWESMDITWSRKISRYLSPSLYLLWHANSLIVM